jgi:tRNA(Ile)-lysidine synthase
MVPEPASLERFARDLDALLPSCARLGVAVSGGPDSLALLLLAAAARPGGVEAATVDHGLRPESAGEADMVAQLCERLEVPHATLTAHWRTPPVTAIQERARRERYRLLGFWAEERGLPAIATAHHADDQAETLLMRLMRGAGVRGLAGMRPRSIAPGTEVRLLRPLLGWRRSELQQACASAKVTAVADPSNADEKFERVRMRHALGDAEWIDAAAVARSAANLAEADSALDWAMRREWKQAAREDHGVITYRPGDVPREILRRIAARAVRKLASEGEKDLRGAELDRLIATLTEGGSATLRGVLCRGGAEWRFTAAPERRALIGRQPTPASDS